MKDEEKAHLVERLEREGLLAELELELTWQRLLSICWLIFWRCCVGLIAILSVFDVLWRRLVGSGANVTGVNVDNLAMAMIVIGVVLALVWCVFVIRMALITHYRRSGFRLIVVPR